MKIRSVKYLVGEGIKSTWANRLMSLASVGVLVACMIVIGLAVLISENVSKALGRLEEQNVIMVYMKDYTWAQFGEHDAFEAKEDSDKNGISPSDYVIHDEKEAKKLCDKIAALSNVEAVKFVSSEEGLKSIKKDMLEGQEEYFSFLDEDGGNPISCAAKVTMDDMSKFDETIEAIKKINGVDAIQSQGELADKITAIKNGMAIAGICIITILLIIALVIVSNTIRVTMYSRKLQISIMKAVGATNSFVRLPFVIEGMLIGIISAFISEGVLYFCYRIAAEAIAEKLNTTNIVAYSSVAVELLILFIAIGIISGILGSFIIISKYLRREGSEFTAL